MPEAQAVFLDSGRVCDYSEWHAGFLDGFFIRTCLRRGKSLGNTENQNICHAYRLGRVEYQEAWDIQRKLADLRAKDRIPDTLLLLEHPPTYTLGRRSGKEHFFVPPRWVEEGRARVHCVDRGGDVTFHGPGQLVGYPIIRLKRSLKETVRYLRDLEEVLIRALEPFEIRAERIKGYTGVWTEGKKIAAIGVKVNVHGVALHGFALNVNTDLSYFKKIVPCGLREREVTSLEQISGHPVDMDEVMDQVIRSFEKVFKVRIIEMDRSGLTEG